MGEQSAEVQQTVDNIGQIVRRDGGALDFEKYDAATGELVVTFRTAPNDECAACTIDEATVRAFLEEAVKAQGIEMTSLQIQTS
jgi:Fe-S cluster biogenesis protein NfuA